MVSFTHPRLADLAFYGGLLGVTLFFFWSRINSSDYLYFVGDGTAIVAMIREMLASGDWTADLGRIAHTFSLQKEWQGFAEIPVPGGHYLNLSGYMVVATAVCKVLSVLGFDTLTIPFMLHGLNVLLQSLTLLLLFLIGKQLAGRSLGLLNMLFFAGLPLAVTEAHYERPESWLVFLSTLMLFALLKYPQAPRRSALVIGSAFGFLVAVKFSQLFLGIIPFAMLCHVFSRSSPASLFVRTRNTFSYGAILATGMVAAIVINVPFILNRLPDYFIDVSRTSGFFDTPHPMYAIEQYSYVSQLFFIGNYFLSTLGIAWCLILLWGFCLCLFAPEAGVKMPLYYRLSLATPPLFILFYISSKYNFMERIFSSTEPMLCILSAISVHSVYTSAEKFSHKKIPLIAALVFLMVVILYKPMELNYKFVQHHIRQPGYQPRIEFQEVLKNDFAGFWIKNVHVTAGFTGALLEKPEKAPRIYHLEDYNQYWTAPHLEKLQRNGFILIATYCSDFSELPVSNQTIYHAAAKNHYLVRQDEWPVTLASGYFRTNCP